MLAKIITILAAAVLVTTVTAANVPTPRLTLSDCPIWVPECKSNSPFPFFTPAPTPTGDAFSATAKNPALAVNDEYVIAGRAVEVENRDDSVLILEPTIIQEGGQSITVYHTLSYPETVTQTVFLSSAETPAPSESVASVSNSGYPSGSESQTTTSLTTTSLTSTTWQTVSVPASGSGTPGSSTTATETATTSSLSLSETPTNPIGSTSVPSEVTSWTTETASQPSTLVTATGSPSSSESSSQTTVTASHSTSSGTTSGTSTAGTSSHPSASATASSQASDGRAAKAGGAVLAGLGGMIVLLA
ncbi:hypothetical protein BR93DRAFT_955228 [Coniochaeta sp. PMI_546]|nr:hypothetical protein BR93DRAFT_955228 [Coniochaeta sp. PMI_546]